MAAAMTPKKLHFGLPNTTCERISSPTILETALSHREPYVKSGLQDSEIKRRTGFYSEQYLLGFITVICDGDSSIISQTHSSLTWYEEWFMYFEITWGRTL